MYSNCQNVSQLPPAAPTAARPAACRRRTPSSPYFQLSIGRQWPPPNALPLPLPLPLPVTVTVALPETSVRGFLISLNIHHGCCCTCELFPRLNSRGFFILIFFFFFRVCDSLNHCDTNSAPGCAGRDLRRPQRPGTGAWSIFCCCFFEFFGFLNFKSLMRIPKLPTP
jgi:hypothetical protein